ncbi:MAG TPA: putative glycoside hydrolase [Streptosporangiaceae bacterium]|nr:putative glycoside hydrolase [Streptosporangiaceae bacterium]
MRRARELRCVPVQLTAAAALLVALAVAALTLAEVAGSPPRRPGSPAIAGGVRAFTQVLDEAQVRATAPAQWATLARENTVVVLNSWDYHLIPVLKRANPGVQVWVYKNLSGVRSDDCTTPSGQCGSCPSSVTDHSLLSSGLGYCWVRRNHPDWLLRAAGSRGPLEFSGYPDTWETDYGNLAYQRQWTANVVADVHRHGWDGVDVDNALTTADAYGTAARYRTDATVQAATYSALRTIGHAMHQARVAWVVNVGYATRFPGLWQRWLRLAGGLEQEYYLSFTTQPDGIGPAWAAYQQEVSSCAGQHKVCWFHAGGYTTAVTSQTRAYALASFLLATDGRQLLSVGGPPPLPLAPGWALGRPLGPMHSAGAAWLRPFAHGLAVVNPTASSTPVDLGGKYLTRAGHPVPAVMLRPASGAVLRPATKM